MHSKPDWRAEIDMGEKMSAWKKFKFWTNRAMEWWMDDVIMDSKYGSLVSMLVIGPTMVFLAVIIVIPVLLCFLPFGLLMWGW